MFDTKDLEAISQEYFNVICTSEYDVTVQSKNTGHFWYLHNVTQPNSNACVIFHKHKYSHPYHLHGSACYMMDEEVPADVQHLRDIVDTMTEKQQLVYKLHVLEGYSFTEIARLMGTSIPNVKKHYDKAILYIKNNF